MSGFAAVVDWRRHPVESDLVVVAREIAARGPDRQRAQVLEPGVGLCHAAFDVDPARPGAVQPVVHPSRPIAVAFDCRLDDPADLRRALAASAPFDLQDEAALLLAAYLRWGERMAEHVIGDFAGVVWDGERHRLVAMRDLVGIRPAFWARTSGGLVVASTLAAVASCLRGRHVDHGHVAEMASGLQRGRDTTMIREVRRLPGGHVLTASDKGITSWQWYRAPERERQGTFEESVEAVRAAVDQAVQSCSAGVDPVGADLSGGLDSSTVVATLARVRDRRIVPVSDRYPGYACDESPYVDAVLDHLALKGRSVDGTQIDDFDPVVDTRTTWDCPQRPGVGVMLARARVLRTEGCRVLLTGQGGDETLGGSSDGRLEELVRQRRFITAFRGCGRAGYSWRQVSRHVLRNMGGDRVNRLLEVRHRRRLDRSFPWLTSSLVRDLGRPGAPSALSSSPGAGGRTGRLDDLVSGPCQMSMELVDRVGVLAGMELRHPLLDRRLVDLVLTLPESHMMNGGDWRHLHRVAFGPRLPADVARRTSKSEFSVPAFEVMRHWRAGEHFADLTSAGWFQPEPLERLWLAQTAAHDRGEPHLPGLWPVWGVWAAETWWRSNEDRVAP